MSAANITVESVQGDQTSNTITQKMTVISVTFFPSNRTCFYVHMCDKD